MGLFSKLKEGLTKTNNIISGIDNIFNAFLQLMMISTEGQKRDSYYGRYWCQRPTPNSVKTARLRLKRIK